MSATPRRRRSDARYDRWSAAWSDHGPLVVSFALAVLLHGGFLVPGVAHVLRHPGERGGRIQFLALTQTQLAQARKILAEQEKAEPEKPKPPLDPEEPTEAPGQVVALPPPRKEETPDKADHASEYAQKVERETRSRSQTNQTRNPTHAPQDGREALTPAPESETKKGRPVVSDRPPGGPIGEGRSLTGKTGTDDASGAGQQQFALEIPRQAPRQGLHLKLDPNGLLANQERREAIDGNSERARLALGGTPDEVHKSGDGDEALSGQGLRGGAGRDGAPSLEALTPSLGQLERIAGLPANDHLPEVETDAETRLNAWRWKHSTFFNRIADAIRRTWKGGDVLTTDDPTGERYGFSDRMTVVQVTLDKRGEIVDIAVADPSGAISLDDEAVRAFKAAGPFANPPEALFKGGEKFTFLFGFNISYAHSGIDFNWRPY